MKRVRIFFAMLLASVGIWVASPAPKPEGPGRQRTYYSKVVK